MLRRSVEFRCQNSYDDERLNAYVRVKRLRDPERPNRSELRLVGQIFANAREIHDGFYTS